MPKLPKLSTKLLRDWISNFPDGVYSTDGRIIYCQPCKQEVKCAQLSHLQQHNETKKHQENFERNRSKQPFLLASSSNAIPEIDPFVEDLADALIGSNIPFYKINNPSLKSFLEKYTNRRIPDESTLRKNYLDVCFLQGHMQDRAIPVPYTSRLLTEISPGQTLNVHGDVMPDATRFEINLLSGCTEIDPHMGSVPLHLNVRFDDGKVVLNSFSAGEWGKEERYSNPFSKGEQFDIRIRVHDERLEIFANQKLLAEFKHRILYTNIDHLQVRGDVALSGVHWGGRYFELPFQATFHGHSLRSGQRVFLYGVPNGDFSVNFVSATGDKLFHLNPRFGEKKIVRGSQKDGNWGPEEREGEFPLKKGNAVDIAIYNEPYSIQVFINGTHYCAFAHRADPTSDYKFVRIEGDIEMTGLEVSH